MTQEYGIGEAARRVGVAAHVLRHWEDMGVLVPIRAQSGHRRYTENDVAQAALVRRAQRAGMSLSDIRTLLTADRAAREHIVSSRLAVLRATIQESQAAMAFLEHTRTCRHHMIMTCPECADYARACP